MAKCGTARQDKADSVIQYVHIACCMTKASDTHSEYVILIATSGSIGYANWTQCYVDMYNVCPVCYTSSYVMRVFCSVRMQSHAVSTALYCIVLV